MMAAVEVVEDKATRARFDRGRMIGEQIAAEAALLGLWSRNTNDVFSLAPPLTTTKDEIEKIVTMVDGALKAVLG